MQHTCDSHLMPQGQRSWRVVIRIYVRLGLRTAGYNNGDASSRLPPAQARCAGSTRPVQHRHLVVEKWIGTIEIHEPEQYELKLI